MCCWCRMAVAYVFPMFMIPVCFIRGCIVFKRGAIKDKVVGAAVIYVHNKQTWLMFCLAYSNCIFDNGYVRRKVILGCCCWTQLTISKFFGRSRYMCPVCFILYLSSGVSLGSSTQRRILYAGIQQLAGQVHRRQSPRWPACIP
jgi:hypothetical protein